MKFFCVHSISPLSEKTFLFMKSRNIFTLFLISFLSIFSGFSTHITNADMHCVFIDSNGNNFRYMVRLYMIRDCSPGNILFPNQMEIGVYSSANLQLIAGLTIPLKSKNKFSDCNGICQEQAIFEGIVLLPRTNIDYHICALFCCRNKTDNLMLDQNGTSYQGNMPYCRISGSIPVNTSISTLPPFIYLKTGEKDTLSYKIFDPLADSISLVLSAPLAGASLANNYPGIPDRFPGFSNVVFTSGYNFNKPLGLSSDFIPDNINKKIYLTGNTSGNFITSLTISTFKTGRLISRSIKEILVYVSPSITKDIEFDLSAYPALGPTAKLSWVNCISDVESYYIQRSDSVSGNYFNIDSVSAYTKNFLDNKVFNNKVYYYRIKAKSVSGNIYFTDSVRVHIWRTGAGNQLTNENNLLQVFPLPVNTFCHILLKDKQIQGYKVIDINGKTILSVSEISPAEETVADLQLLGAGLYLIEVQSTDFEIYQFRFSKI